MPEPDPGLRKNPLLLPGALLALLGFGLWALGSGAPDQGAGRWSYSQLLQQARAHRVKQVRVRGTEAEVTDRQGRHWTVVLPPRSEQAARLLTAEGAEVSYQVQTGPGWLPAQLAPTLLTLLIGLVTVVIVVTLVQRRRPTDPDEPFDFLRAASRAYGPGLVSTRLSDVAGAHEAKQELVDVVEFLRWPVRFRAVGARVPRGVLLSGPPGTGKTLLARAVAGEAGVPFFPIAASEFIEMFAGVGAARIRDLFRQARERAPSIVFIDELDAIGRDRGRGSGGGEEERDQTLNQLLVEMDGFEGGGVIVMAATNRPEILDPALLRPGRFDRHVSLQLPDVDERREILEVHRRGKPLEPTVDLGLVAKETPGLSGADLASLLNEAAILAARHGRRAIGPVEVEEAVARAVAGPPRWAARLVGRERERVAYHLAGHVLVTLHLLPEHAVRRVSIVGRGRSLGWMLDVPADDGHLECRGTLTRRIAALLGGRAAMEVVFADPTSAAEDDIAAATALARRMVTRWGMGCLGDIGLAALGTSPVDGSSEAASCSEEMMEAVDQEIRALLERAHAWATRVLRERRTQLDAVAQRLLEVESIDGTELESLVGDRDRAVPVTRAG